MAIILVCPAGHRLKVPSKFMGRRIVCPVCDSRIDVPLSTATTTRNDASETSDRSDALGAGAPSSKEPTLPPPTDNATSPAQSTDLQQPGAQLTVHESPQPPEERPSVPMPPEALCSTATDHTLEQPQTLPQTEETLEPAMLPEFAIRELEFPVANTELTQRQSRFVATFLLSIASVGVALFCLVPSVIEQSMARQFGLRSPDVWSYIVILVALIQIGMAIFAIRVPDWSTVWLLTITAALVSSIHAAGLALTMFAGQNHVFVGQLGLLDEAIRYRAQPWCFLVVCLALMLAYFCGRYSVGWCQMDVQMRQL